MAQNPPISQDGQPFRVQGEYLILERKDIEAEIKMQNQGKLSGKGKLYLSTTRLVFVNKDFKTSQFKSFDMPLLFLFNEKFEQPIFGSNYLELQLKPFYNLIPGITTVKLWFTSGGCQKFLKCFIHVLKKMRSSQGRDNQFVEQVRAGQFSQNNAFVDPDDPSVMFVEQPQNNFNNDLNQNQYFGNKNMYQFQSFQGQGQQIGTYEPQFNNQQNQVDQRNQFQQQNQFGNANQFQQPNYQQQDNQYQQPNQFMQPNQMQQQNQFQQPMQNMQFAQQQNPYQTQQIYNNPNMQNQQFQNQQNQQFDQQIIPQGGVQIGSNVGNVNNNAYNYPSLDNLQPQNNPIQNQQQNNQQNIQPNNQQNNQIQSFQIQQPQQPQQANAAYYYGFWGPELQRNH